MPFLGAGALILDEHDRMLLVLETGVGKRGKWSLPAGKVEPGESVIDAMIREVREETGCTVDPVDIGFAEMALLVTTTLAASISCSCDFR